jgi:hypothetical protein
MDKLVYHIKFSTARVNALREKARILSCELGEDLSWHDLVRLGADLIIGPTGGRPARSRRQRTSQVTN